MACTGRCFRICSRNSSQRWNLLSEMNLSRSVKCNHAERVTSGRTGYPYRNTKRDISMEKDKKQRSTARRQTSAHEIGTRQALHLTKTRNAFRNSYMLICDAFCSWQSLRRERKENAVEIAWKAYWPGLGEMGKRYIPGEGRRPQGQILHSSCVIPLLLFLPSSSSSPGTWVTNRNVESREEQFGV